MARRVHGVSVRGPRRQTAWFGFNFSEATLTSAGTIIFTLNALALAFRPFTVVRTRLAFFLRSDQVAAIEDQAVAFGMAVVSEEADAVGITAVPIPMANIDSDLWFFHKVMFAGQYKDSTSGFAGTRG